MLDHSSAQQAPSGAIDHQSLAHGRSPAFLGTDVIRRVLPGMVARGHGIAALCVYLSLAQSALLDLIVLLDMPTPPDQPLRKPGRLGWSFADTALFVTLWMAGWHVDSLSARFGRSRCGIWSKGRRLGLPRRDRKSIIRPPRQAAAPSACEQVVAPSPIDGASIAEPELEPAPVTALEERHSPEDSRCSPDPIGADAPIDPLETPTLPCTVRDETAPAAVTPSSVPAVEHAVPALITPVSVSRQTDLFPFAPISAPSPSKPKRQETRWTRALDLELADRWWARQHYRSIARDMRISAPAVQARRVRLGLPSTRALPDLGIFNPDELVDHFDPSVIKENIELAGYVERRCNKLGEAKGVRFWSKRDGCRTSPLFTRLESKRSARVSAAKPKRKVPSLEELSMFSPLPPMPSLHLQGT